jgi:CDP-diacylglycerol--glycerol-3-phosphate 3-phosphatidyltransferase/cardiolipin synthase
MRATSSAWPVNASAFLSAADSQPRRNALQLRSSSRTVRSKWLTPPNLVSLARIPLAVLFLAVHDYTARVLILVITAASDFVDGWVARHYAKSSREGEIIDPAADKIFLTAAIIGLAVHGVVTTAELLVLLARDIATSIGFAVVVLRRIKNVRLKSRFPGKVVTCLQLATVLVLTIVPVTRAHGPALVCVWITGAASAWALFDYISFGIRSLRARSQPR